ncbi:DUF2795 domain-containing protein [Silvanigrella sp.]|jgi:hypothetical protein|uniref:DUF2795 domain-containing protein n=1 Tax=Silvanigrella sp. TaxID=2024976 RepID=UPI0037CC43F1
MTIESTSVKNTEKDALQDKSNIEKIEKYLKGNIFPSEKKHLIECANKNTAPKYFLDDLNKLKDKKYENNSEIMKDIYN